jgi:hypothetical protein
METHELYQDDIHAGAQAFHAHCGRDQIEKHVVNKFDLVHDQVLKLSIFRGKQENLHVFLRKAF